MCIQYRCMSIFRKLCATICHSWYFVPVALSIHYACTSVRAHARVYASVARFKRIIARVISIAPLNALLRGYSVPGSSKYRNKLRPVSLRQKGKRKNMQRVITNREATRTGNGRNWYRIPMQVRSLRNVIGRFNGPREMYLSHDT